jgi:hypothetical protein
MFLFYAEVPLSVNLHFFNPVNVVNKQNGWLEINRFVVDILLFTLATYEKV